MTTPEAETEKRPAKGKALKDCEPLIEAATRQIYDNNAFRITGLPVTASAKEISKHGERLQVLQELGQAATTNGPFAKALPPTADEIREALQRLREPEYRLIDEFFWFWPNELSDGKAEAAMQALWQGDDRRAIDLWRSQELAQDEGYVARHNLAVAYHLRVIDSENTLVEEAATAEQQRNIENGWQEALARWEKIATDEQLWGRVSERIRQLDDPRLTTGFGRRIRGSLPEALDKVNAEFALAYAESGKMTEAARHIGYMRQTNQGIDNVEKTSELVLAPARTRIVEQMTRAKERAEKDPKEGIDAAKELMEHGRQILTLFDLFFGENHSTPNELSDDIARICNRLLVSYHEATGDDKKCQEILKAVLPLATSIDLRQQIENGIRTLGGNLQNKELEPIYQALKANQDSTEKAKRRLDRMRNELEPMLKSNWSELLKYKEQKDQICDAFAVVLREISLAAWNNEKDKATAVAANNWALEYAMGGELLARLNQDRQTLRVLGLPASATRQSLSSARYNSRLKVALAIILLGIVYVLSVVFRSDSSSSTTTPNSYTTPSTSYSPPSSYGNAYRVSSSIASELRTEGAAIETDRAALTALSNQIDVEKSNLDYAERTLNRYNQYAVDTFNAKVHNYNALLEDYKLKQAAFNARVDAHNEKFTGIIVNTQTRK